MRTQSWEVRCFSFFLGIAEANSFSAFKYFTPDGEDVLHNNFRWRLAESLKTYISELRDESPVDTPATRSSTRVCTHSLVALGKTKSNKPIARQCTLCKKKTQTRCSCGHSALCKRCIGKHVYTFVGEAYQGIN